MTRRVVALMLAQVLAQVLALAAVAVAQEAGAGVLTLEAQAQRALQEGKAAAAADAYLALAAAEPQQAKWVVGAVEAMTRGARFRDALDYLDTAQQRFKDNLELRVLCAKVNMLLAENLAAGGKRDRHVLFAYEEAAQVARGIVEAHADNRDARLILAEAEFAIGNLDEALAQATQVGSRHELLLTAPSCRAICSTCCCGAAAATPFISAN